MLGRSAGLAPHAGRRVRRAPRGFSKGGGEVSLVAGVSCSHRFRHAKAGGGSLGAERPPGARARAVRRAPAGWGERRGLVGPGLRAPTFGQLPGSALRRCSGHAWEGGPGHAQGLREKGNLSPITGPCRHALGDPGLWGERCPPGGCSQKDAGACEEDFALEGGTGRWGVPLSPWEWGESCSRRGPARGAPRVAWPAAASPSWRPGRNLVGGSCKEIRAVR